MIESNNSIKDLSKTPEKFFEDYVHSYFKFIQQNKIEEVKRIINELENADLHQLRQKNIVNHLIQKKSGDTGLHVCAKLGFIDIIKYLVEIKCANLEQTNLDGKSALHDAAQFSNFDVVSYLLQKGANVNVVKKADWTPLMLACTKQNADIINILLENDANVFFINKDGWNCLHLASREGNPGIIKLIFSYLKNYKDQKTLCQCRSRNGRKPLHTAVMHGHLEVAKLLVEEEGVEHANEEDHCGTSPVMDACRFGFLDLISFFKEFTQADLTKCNQQGLNCLDIAAEAGQSKTIKFLVEKYNMDINRRTDSLLFSPLHWAAKEGQSNAVQTLVELGADIKIVDLKGRTSLDLALTFKHPQVVSILKELSSR